MSRRPANTPEALDIVRSLLAGIQDRDELIQVIREAGRDQPGFSIPDFIGHARRAETGGGQTLPKPPSSPSSTGCWR